MDIKEVKEYLETEIDKALSELKDDQNNVELHSRFLAFYEILDWIEEKEREERNKKFHVKGEKKGNKSGE